MKLKLDYLPLFMSEVFRYIGKGKETRAGDKFAAEKSISLKWGDRSLRTFGPVVWNTMLPENLKASVSLDTFKVDIKSWIPDDCPCKLCKIYVEGMGYISKKDVKIGP